MIIKFAHVILLAAIKFIVTLPYALIIGMEYNQALLAVLTGGIGGFIFFLLPEQVYNSRLLQVFSARLHVVAPGF